MEEPCPMNEAAVVEDANKEEADVATSSPDGFYKGFVKGLYKTTDV